MMLTISSHLDVAKWYDPAGNRRPASDHRYNTYNAADMLLANGLNGDTLSGSGRSNVWDSQKRLA
ncbi:MAG: hypothetical protein IT209_00365 [Armatimonadetes bacterium]|nr:hypothetical protein [Armatimonadota bacterium]